MRKIVIVTIVACAPFAAATARAQRGTLAPASGGGRGVLFESRIVTGLPYSAEILSESIQTLVDGNRIVQHTTGRVYRDSEGRVRREEDRPSGGPYRTPSRRARDAGLYR